MVGFVLYGVDVETGKWKIFRLMIDRAHQGKGYGRAVMEQVIKRLSAQPDCNEILIAYQTTNDTAQRLYESLGFTEEIVNDDKVTARLDLGNMPTHENTFWARIMKRSETCQSSTIDSQKQ